MLRCSLYRGWISLIDISCDSLRNIASNVLDAWGVSIEHLLLHGTPHKVVYPCETRGTLWPKNVHNCSVLNLKLYLRFEMELHLVCATYNIFIISSRFSYRKLKWFKWIMFTDPCSIHFVFLTKRAKYSKKVWTLIQLL